MMAFRMSFESPVAQCEKVSCGVKAQSVPLKSPFDSVSLWMFMTSGEAATEKKAYGTDLVCQRPVFSRAGFTSCVRARGAPT